MNYLTKPLTKEEIEDRNGQIEEIIAVDLVDLVWTSVDDTFDMFSEQVIGNVALQGMSYEAKGVTKDGEILIQVSGVVEDDDLANLW